MEILEVTDAEFYNLRMCDTVKKVSMIGGQHGADFEIIHKDCSSKLYKIV